MHRTIEVSHSFRAMNSDVEAVICLPANDRKLGERLLRHSQVTFDLIERTLSRFNPDSELSLLNASAGRSVKASRLLFSVVEAAIAASRSTSGIFDPTLLPELINAGYDRSFENLSDHPQKYPQLITGREHTWQDIRLDPTNLNIYLPEGCTIDLGGIGKGWAVDTISPMFSGFPGFALDAGGDIGVGGRQVSGDRWTVGIADPHHHSRDLRTLEMDRGCICTSTTTKRRWMKGGLAQHHLIDPRTGKPADSGVSSVTVISNSAAAAETIAKAALILGRDAGLNLIDQQTGSSGLMVLDDGQMAQTSDFPHGIAV